MNYKIKVRKANTDDTSPECPYINQYKDKYEIYLSSLLEDISNNDNIEEVNLNENEIFITSKLTKNNIENELEHLFKRDFCYIKFISIEETV
jgi:hypothetical protein